MHCPVTVPLTRLLHDVRRHAEPPTGGRGTSLVVTSLADSLNRVREKRFLGLIALAPSGDRLRYRKKI